MAIKKSKLNKAPDNINEEYYQISTEILSSFSKYRPPVDLFKFTESICTLEPYSKKGQRITNEQVEEMHNLCANGILFVSRSDHAIYSEHIVMQLDLVLQDANLKEGEIANICTKALILKLNRFIQQPQKENYDILYKDIMVFTEFISQDKHRIKIFVKRIIREYSLAAHSFNCLVLGLWLWIETTAEYRREELDKMAVALFIHDIGMSKVPPFIISKTTALTPDEREKFNTHALAGYNVFQKLDVNFDELTKATTEHHERNNGSGYPRKLKAEAISKVGRLTGIVDSFSLMISKSQNNPKPKSVSQVTTELMNNSAHYDHALTLKVYAAFNSSTFGDISELLKDL